MHRVFLRILEELGRTSGLPPVAKMLYAATMTEKSPSIQSLAAKLGIGRWAVTRHCKELEQAGWMKITEEGRFRRPAAIVPADVEAKVAQEVRELIELSPFLGEATFKGFAVWILHPAVKLAFNVRPPFLRNKSTGQNLECDVAALEHAWVGEYQGPQHFGPTELFKGEKEFIERYKRDQLKAELCKKHAIRLSCVTKNDLTLQGVLDVLPADIPRRVIDPAGPFVKMLESLGRKVAEGKDWDRDRKDSADSYRSYPQTLKTAWLRHSRRRSSDRSNTGLPA